MRRTLLTALALGLFVASPAVVFADDAPAKTEEPKKLEPIDYHKLKDTLKETFGDLKRTHAEGSKSKFGEVSISQAKADYSADKDNSEALTATVTILDYANTEMAKGFAAWSSLDIDQESDDGYQKTTKIEGNPAMEQFQIKDKSGTVTVIVAERFIVTYEARNATKEQFQALIKALPVKEIAALKN